MASYELPYFGEIDLDEEQDFFETELTLDGNTFSIDLDFENEVPKKKQLDIVKRFLENLPTHCATAQAAIRADFAQENAPSWVREYIRDFMPNLEDEDAQGRAAFYDETDATRSPEEQMAQRFRLNRLGLYPTEKTFAVFDYTLSTEHTNDLLVIYFNADGQVDGMTAES